MTALEVRAHDRSKFGVLLTASLVSSLIIADSNIVSHAEKKRPCKFVDCRDRL
jgi:hypothetical protein